MGQHSRSCSVECGVVSLNFQDDMSEASVLRLQSYQNQFRRQGQTIEDVWTFYPHNDAKTCRIVASGIRTCPTQRNPSMLVEGLPVEKESANFLLQSNPELLRGVEMFRHLPMPVCQFDTEGRCMYQDPDAMLPGSSADKKAAIEKKNKVQRTNSNSTVDTTCTDDSSERTQGKGPQEASLDVSNSNDNKDNDEVEEAKKEDDTDTEKDIGCSFTERFVDPEVGRKALQELLQKEEDTAHTNTNNSNNNPTHTRTKKIDATLHTRLGPRRCEVHLVQAKDPVTGETVILFSSRDLTDALAAKREKENSHKKSEFLAIMAHEIRTPLHQVTGFIDFCWPKRQQLFRRNNDLLSRRCRILRVDS